jgi:hypothetical protein
VSQAFYERDGDGYLATELTRGPWDPGAQHAGPPAALLAREMERLDGGSEFQVGRITFEILRPVPIAALSVSARLLRPGKRVQLIAASLCGEKGEELIRASGWRIRPAELDLPPTLLPHPAPPGPEQGRLASFFPTGQDVGYHTAMQLRVLSGDFLEPGPAAVWLRMRYPLLDGEEPTPLQRVMIAADVGNGISAVVDWRRFLFINVELTVHLERMPDGEWVCVDAITIPGSNGIGTAESVLADRRGRIGRAAQTLLIRER